MTAHFALALLLAASGTAVAATASMDTVATTDSKKTKPKKICKTDSRVTGTRIAKRICKTEEEWASNEDGQELSVKGHAGNQEQLCMSCKSNP